MKRGDKEVKRNASELMKKALRSKKTEVHDQNRRDVGSGLALRGKPVFGKTMLESRLVVWLRSDCATV